MLTEGGQFEIYQQPDGQMGIEVFFDNDTVWLNRNQMSSLFQRDVKTIGKHLSNLFDEGELEQESVVAKIATTATDGKTYQVEHYNLDVIISIGYRVKSIQGTRFRKWATKRLKDYLVQGYAINERRIAEKDLELKVLKDGIRIVGRALEQSDTAQDKHWLQQFSAGLALLDDYDHESLDQKGLTLKPVVYPSLEEYLEFIKQMYSSYQSDVFAQPKDESFESSIGQIAQTFDGKELYPSLEEKAATLLYLIVKNHSFVDGNKRIAAACFLYFLGKNDKLKDKEGSPLITNKALASLTLFVAVSKPEEMQTVKQLIISILNRKD
jgi:prophage maintenance system killer protein